MKITIDVQVPRGTKRVAMLSAIPLAIVAGGAAIALAGVPNTFTSGEGLSSSKMNANFASLDGRLSAVETALGATGDAGVQPPPTSPAGSVMAFAGVLGGAVSPPAGWLLCDGSAVSRTTYAALFTAIGTTAGAGDGATTFNVPDYRGYFLRGFDQGVAGRDPDGTTRTALNTGGNTGDLVGTLELGALASHTHSVTDPGHSHTTTVSSSDCSGGNPDLVNFNGQLAETQITNSCHQYPTSAVPTGVTVKAAGGSETRPNNVAVNYIIKF